MIDSKLRAKDRIYSELPEDLKKLMLKYVLTEDEHLKVLEDIKEKSYDKKQPVEDPKFTVVLGQTGSGKSNLTASLYNDDSNMVIIDSDKYKAFRSDSEEILKKHLVEYAFLTAPDAYLHRDEMIVDAIEKRYNILMECAPSNKDGLFVDLPKLQEQGYHVELCILGVSSLNSSLSVHERYEARIQLNDVAAKLTNISRHDDSFSALNNVVRKFQNLPNIRVKVYSRGRKYPYIPNLIYSSDDNTKRFSCALEALIDAQGKDEADTLQNFDNRYNIVKNQMINRNAPIKQIEQLEDIRLRYERKVENKREL